MIDLSSIPIAVSGDAIKAARERLGLTQQELAYRARVSLKTVAAIEEDRVAGLVKDVVMAFLGFICTGSGKKPH